MGEDVTEGQMADYMAAELSGDWGDWGIAVVAYHCMNCGANLEVISDYLKDLDALILRWHDKAKSGDYFEKYVFEYLAFNAFLKTHIALQAPNDRHAIESFKKSKWKDAYLQLLESEQESEVRDSWLSIIDELKREPFSNSSRDYDYPEFDGKWSHPDASKRGRGGTVYALNDWGNMVEFWHSVRNNLFHAGVDPTHRRDMFMVKHAFITLNALMRLVVRSLNLGFAQNFSASE